MLEETAEHGGGDILSPLKMVARCLKALLEEVLQVCSRAECRGR
ncbi:MAG: hypothetical protein QOJ51_2443 [Acidobacteriaceae bacterium]|nr:hypothetical protein [Acidobacteriaceae bacterium]